MTGNFSISFLLEVDEQIGGGGGGGVDERL